MKPENSETLDWAQGFGLSLSQVFEKERMERAIDSCSNVEDLKSLSKQLLSAWMNQSAACSWIMRHTVGEIPSKALLDKQKI